MEEHAPTSKLPKGEIMIGSQSSMVDGYAFEENILSCKDRSVEGILPIPTLEKEDELII